MGLQTTMTTSLTGMTAAETTIDVVGNNIANANTVGFKESSVSFATQFLQTQSIGSSPTDSRGGTNPRQVGLGVKVAEITPDFTQGTVEISSNPLDLAIQGDGFFIVQGPQGEQFYTRNGQFKTNANNEIVTITGHRVLGYSVDANFEIQPTGLTPLSIPLGAAAVAQATTNVTMTGNLNPNDGVATQPEIIESIILSDGAHEAPVPPTTTPLALSRPNVTGVTYTSGPAGATFAAGNVYQYKVSFVDDNGNEGPASAPTTLQYTVPAGGTTQINLAGIPMNPPNFPNMRIYRDQVGGSPNYEFIAEVGAATTYNDTTASGGAALTETGLSSNTYSYYITFASSTNPNAESRPSAQFGPITTDAANAPRIRLDDIPTPTTPEYDRVRIYRNVSNDPNSFYLVDEINPTAVDSYIDSMPDATLITQEEINLDGPGILPGTLLTDVMTYSNGEYISLFEEGELSFQGAKNGRDQAERTLTIDSTTTIQNLISFMEESLGIVETAPEDTFPAPFGGYGGNITTDSRLTFTSNLGEENALSIDLSAFRLTPTGGDVQSVPLEFDSIQEADGPGSTADLIVYDSLGTPVRVTVTTVVENVDSSGARFRWIATSPDHDVDSSGRPYVGTGVITTDANGKFLSASDNRIAVARGGTPAATPLDFELDFSQITGLDDDTSWAAGVQDGLAAGTLTSFIITESGRISGVFSNGSSRDLGQIRMARFANNGGLEQIGDNLFQAGVNSGLPIQGDPGSQGIGAITAGAVELSNTDIGQNLIELILASTQYRGGARVITAVQQLLDELLALRR
jgi:flagellar hook protein FlgE